MYFKKSQPAPECLEIEKAKANGDYKCGDVLVRLKDDFKNKCYICGYKEPVSINVEHFIPHRGDQDLKFDWNNLFWACVHCNKKKGVDFDNILDCTKQADHVDTALRYHSNPFPFEKVEIEALTDDVKVEETKDLLLDIYNGTTPLGKIEASNLRNKLLKEIFEFQGHLIDYFKDTNDDEDRKHFLIKIKGHLDKASNFTAFKRWIVTRNEGLMQEFGRFIN
jgi:hypothetical protein